MTYDEWKSHNPDDEYLGPHLEWCSLCQEMHAEDEWCLADEPDEQALHYRFTRWTALALLVSAGMWAAAVWTVAELVRRIW